MFGPTSNLADFKVLLGEWENADDGELVCTAVEAEPEAVVLGDMEPITGPRYAKYTKGSLAGEIGQGFWASSGSSLADSAFAVTYQPDGIRFRRWDGSAFTTESLGFVTIATGPGDVCEVRIDGTALRAYVNGTAVGGFTHAALADVVRFGLRCAHDSPPQSYRDFEAGTL